MMESDPDWVPSLHLGHANDKHKDAARFARQSKREQLRKSSLQGNKRRVHPPGESDHLMEGSSRQCFCSVPGCFNSKQNHPYITFHTFPRDEEMRSTWLELIKMDKDPSLNTDRGLICSMHFDSGDVYVLNSGIKRLKWGAVPCLFSWNNWGKTQEPASAQLGVDVQGDGAAKQASQGSVKKEANEVQPATDHDYANHSLSESWTQPLTMDSEEQTLNSCRTPPHAHAHTQNTQMDKKSSSSLEDVVPEVQQNVGVQKEPLKEIDEDYQCRDMSRSPGQTIQMDQNFNRAFEGTIVKEEEESEERCCLFVDSSGSVGHVIPGDQPSEEFVRIAVKEEEPENEDLHYAASQSHDHTHTTCTAVYSRGVTTMAQNAAWDSEPEEGGHPWPHIQSIFSLQTTKKNSYVMRCHMCLPKHVNISAYKNSTSNLKKHVARVHPNKLMRYTNLLKSKRKRTFSSSDEPPMTNVVMIPDSLVVASRRNAQMDKKSLSSLEDVVPEVQQNVGVQKEPLKEIDEDYQCRDMSRSPGQTILMDQNFNRAFEGSIVKEEEESEEKRCLYIDTSGSLGHVIPGDQPSEEFVRIAVKEEELENEDLYYTASQSYDHTHPTCTAVHSRGVTTMAQNAAWDSEPEERGHPWPHIQSIFSLQTTKKNSYVMRCHMCLPKQVYISAYKNCTSNLKKHVARVHPNKLMRYTNLFKSRRKRKFSSYDESPMKKVLMSLDSLSGASRRNAQMDKKSSSSLEDVVPEVQQNVGVQKESLKEIDEDYQCRDMSSSPGQTIQMDQNFNRAFEGTIVKEEVSEDKPCLYIDTSGSLGRVIPGGQPSEEFVRIAVKEEELENEDLYYAASQSHDHTHTTCTAVHSRGVTTMVQNAAWDSEPEEGGHPWPHIQSIFSLQTTKKNSYVMRCHMCLPKHVNISAYKNSTSNLRKHVARVHPNKLMRYINLMESNRKRKFSSSDEPPMKKVLMCPDSLGVASRRVTQATLDKLVLNFVCEANQPFSVVETPSFQTMIDTLQPQCTVMTSKTLCSKIQEAATMMKSLIVKKLSTVNHVATTTDCWSVRQHSYLGVTCHWIDQNSLERHSAALACRRVKGSHTFEVLGAALEEIHSEYHIREKVTRTTTDSGLNVLKAFRLYGVEEEEDEVADEQEERDYIVDYASENESELEVEYQDASAILDADTGLEYQLPKHQKCAYHLLNLILTVDTAVAVAGSETYERLSQAAFAKCHALWAKASRSDTASEMVEPECKLQFLRPSRTRWSSLFLAVERVVRIQRKQGEKAIRDVCTVLKIKMLNPAEMAFLVEYTAVMKPVAMALKILQGDSSVHMGFLLPTLYQLQDKLKKLESICKVCGPLVEAVQCGLQNRFGEIMNVPELIAAAILLPKFRTYWTTDENILKAGLDYIQNHLDTDLELDYDDRINGSHSDEDDFFASMMAVKSETGELERYLSCPSPGGMNLLHSFPQIKKLSLRLNTSLPASAACERLLSHAGLLFAAKRSQFHCKNLESQLLLKLNTHLTE